MICCFIFSIVLPDVLASAADVQKLELSSTMQLGGGFQEWWPRVVYSGGKLWSGSLQETRFASGRIENRDSQLL